MILAAFVLVAAFFAIYIALPFWEQSFKKKRLNYEEAEKQHLMMKKEEVLEAIQDLEYDHKMRKVSDEDYAHLKENLTKEAVQVMKELDLLDGHSEQNAAGSPKPRKHTRAGS